MIEIKDHFIFTDEVIILNEYNKEEIGSFRYCEPFEVYTRDVKYIAISPRMSFDDETLFILIVDYNNKVLKLPEHVVYESDFMKFENFFSIESLKGINLKFSKREFYKRLNKIIYPSHLYFEDLFVNDILTKAMEFFTQNSNTFKGKIR